MRTRAKFSGASRTIDGDLSLSFVVDDDVKAKLEDLTDKELVLEITQYWKKRSNDANAYFWKLCTLIADAIGSDKDTVYLMQIKDAGVMEVHDVIAEGSYLLEPLFRLIEVDYEYPVFIDCEEGQQRKITMQSLKCYRGSHEYDTKQMSRLIDATVQEAQSLGIETLPPDEIAHMCAVWEAK